MKIQSNILSKSFVVFPFCEYFLTIKNTFETYLNELPSLLST